MSSVRVLPTLAAMADVYKLPRDGGPQSERFRTYVALAPTVWGISSYNPMAGAHALEAVEQLIAIDAENLVLQAASSLADRCGYTSEIALTIAVMSPGMWTDRLATEVQQRTTGKRTPGHGLVVQWTREPVQAETLEREAIAEAARVMWAELHGPASTLSAVLAREGLAYALGSSPFDAPTADDERQVSDALEVLGDSEAMGEIATVLYGDSAAGANGWMPLGVNDHAGYRFAIARARALVTQFGAENALRETPSLIGRL